MTSCGLSTANSLWRGRRSNHSARDTVWARSRNQLTALTIYARSARMNEVVRNGQLVALSPHKWACGAAGSALPWHGRGRRFDPDQVHQISQISTQHLKIR